MSCNESAHHKRSVSSGSARNANERTEYEVAPPPVPPPRSAPSTWRKPRRNVGDRVFVSSPTTVYIDFVDENSRKTMELVSNNASSVEKNENVQCDTVDFNKISENIRHSKDIPKIRNRIFEDSLESQEISFYIGNYKLRGVFLLNLRSSVRLANKLSDIWGNFELDSLKYHC